MSPGLSCPTSAFKQHVCRGGFGRLHIAKTPGIVRNQTNRKHCSPDVLFFGIMMRLTETSDCVVAVLDDEVSRKSDQSVETGNDEEQSARV